MIYNTVEGEINGASHPPPCRPAPLCSVSSSGRDTKISKEFIHHQRGEDVVQWSLKWSLNSKEFKHFQWWFLKHMSRVCFCETNMGTQVFQAVCNGQLHESAVYIVSDTYLLMKAIAAKIHKPFRIVMNVFLSDAELWRDFMSPFRPLLGIICLGYSVNKQLGSCGAISRRCF